MHSAVSYFTLCLLLLCPLVAQTLNRCYSCISKGGKGDCGDTFNPVNELPCSTGWCSKNMEGVATERQCLTKAPSDGKERCAYVNDHHKQVFMCFCKGDLCNGGQGVQSSWVVVAAFSFFLTAILL